VTLIWLRGATCSFCPPPQKYPESSHQAQETRTPTPRRSSWWRLGCLLVSVVEDGVPPSRTRRTIVIAEAGVNHNGDLGLAHRLVDEACNAGADVVKFQSFDPVELVAATAPTADYQRRSTGQQAQREMLDALVLPTSALRELADHCQELGVEFLSTAFDWSSLETLIDIGIRRIKVPSGEIDNEPYLARVATLGLPLVISTGMSDWPDVDRAVALTHGAAEVTLLHCVSLYPTPTELANLSVIPRMRERYGLAVGWSDHTTDIEAGVIAVALGSSVIEKHLTLDKRLPGPDHAASADPDEFGAYVAAIRKTEVMLGTAEKRRVGDEDQVALVARRSHHAARDMAAGEILSPSDTKLLRPATGVPASSKHRGPTPLGVGMRRRPDRGRSPCSRFSPRKHRRRNATVQPGVGRLVAIVPARAGSTRLPGKNTKLVGGVSLIERSVLHARAAGADLIVVSTDDAKVKALLTEHRGLVVVERPPQLATSSASTDDVVGHVIDSLQIERDAMILILQPTSPFRDRSLLSACLASASNNPDAATVTVVRAAKATGWARCMASDGTLAEIPLSCDPVAPSGAVYAFRCGLFQAVGTIGSMRKVGVLSDPIHSCDIDQEFELVIAVALAEAGLGDDIVDSGSMSRSASPP
jgi:N,N'-diacetyllegionaminate synthase